MCNDIFCCFQTWPKSNPDSGKGKGLTRGEREWVIRCWASLMSSLVAGLAAILVMVEIATSRAKSTTISSSTRLLEALLRPCLPSMYTKFYWVVDTICWMHSDILDSNWVQFRWRAVSQNAQICCLSLERALLWMLRDQKKILVLGILIGVLQ